MQNQQIFLSLSFKSYCSPLCYPTPNPVLFKNQHGKYSNKFIKIKNNLIKFYFPVYSL